MIFQMEHLEENIKKCSIEHAWSLGDEEDGDQREGGEEEIDDQVGRTIEELKGEEELKKKLPRLVVRVPRLAPHKVQAATAVDTNIKVDPEQQVPPPPLMVTQRKHLLSGFVHWFRCNQLLYTAHLSNLWWIPNLVSKCREKGLINTIPVTSISSQVYPIMHAPDTMWRQCQNLCWLMWHLSQMRVVTRSSLDLVTNHSWFSSKRD